MTKFQSPLLVSVLDRDDSPLASQLNENLRVEIEEQFAPANRRPLYIQVLDSSGSLLGGLKGFSHWNWVYISHLWTAKNARKMGVATKLIEAAEREARVRGARGLYVDTFTDVSHPESLRFYEKNGYQIVGRIDDFPGPGSSRIYLTKTL